MRVGNVLAEASTQTQKIPGRRHIKRQWAVTFNFLLLFASEYRRRGRPTEWQSS